MSFCIANHGQPIHHPLQASGSKNFMFLSCSIFLIQSSIFGI